MSDVQPTPVALLLSDVHWSDRTPSARRGERDWRAAQAHRIGLLYEWWDRTGQPPIFIAGDLFDRWNEPVGFVSYISTVLDRTFPDEPIFYSVAGNHDLPNHSIDRQEESAYHALHLMQPDRMYDLGTEGPITVNGIDVTGYPWGAAPDKVEADGLSLAVVHRYAYSSDDNGGDIAPMDAAHSMSYGATVTHYGDNHIPWQAKGICNPGSWDVRNKGDINASAGGFGIMYSDGHTELTRLTDPLDVIKAPETKTKAVVPSATEVVSLLEAGVTSTGTISGDLMQYVRLAGAPDPVLDRVNKLLQEEAEQ